VYEVNQSMIGIMFDEASNDVRSRALEQLENRRGSVSSGFLYQDTNRSDMAYFATPATNIYYPIIIDATNFSVVGILGLLVTWETLLGDILGSTTNSSLIVLVENQCGGMFSFSIEGSKALLIGSGDQHSARVADYTPLLNTSYADFLSVFEPHGDRTWDSDTSCAFRMSSYPSSQFKKKVSLTFHDQWNSKSLPDLSRDWHRLLASSFFDYSILRIVQEHIKR
jgi:hypothetical protein